MKPLLPYRLARQGGLAMAPGADGWSLWLRPDVDSDQLHELLRVYGAPQTVCHFDAGSSTRAWASCTRPARTPRRR